MSLIAILPRNHKLAETGDSFHEHPTPNEPRVDYYPPSVCRTSQHKRFFLRFDFKLFFFCIEFNNRPLYRNPDVELDP